MSSSFECSCGYCGGRRDGFQLGLKLAKMGVQYFSIADPEAFEPENSNRVPGATKSTYGRNKAEVFREMLNEINPEAEVTVDLFKGYTPRLHYEKQIWPMNQSFNDACSYYLGRVKMAKVLSESQTRNIKDYLGSIVKNGMITDQNNANVAT